MKRFSLRTILLGVSLVALALGIVVLQTKNRSLRREVETLRAEVGHLVPIFLSQVNVIEVPTQREYTWCWRVYAPEGTIFDAGIISEQVPETGTPSPSFAGAQIPADPHGVLVTAAVTADLDAGYVLTLAFGNRTLLRSRTQLPRDEFLDGSASLTTAGVGGPHVYPFDKPIILHRRRLYEKTSPTTHSEPSGNSRGMMFWITPRKKP